MNAPTEKDYIDSKLQTVIERLNGEARGHQIASDGHLGNFQRDLQAFRVEFNEKISQLEGSIHRSLIDAVKWMIGTMLALTAISITVSSTLFLRLAPKEESPTKAPANVVPSPQPGLSASGAKTLSANLTLAAQSPQPDAIHHAATPARTVH